MIAALIVLAWLVTAFVVALTIGRIVEQRDQQQPR